MTRSGWRPAYDRGIEQYNRNDFASAAASFRRAVKLGGGTPEVRCFLAQCLHSSGRTEKALAEFAAVIESAPDYAHARESLVGILRAADRMEEAVAILGAAASRNPRCAALRREAERLRRETGVRQSRISLLDASAFCAQDVIPLLMGDKPVAYNDATQEQLAFIREWARPLGLHAADLGPVETAEQNDSRERRGVLLAKDPRLLEKAAKLWPSASAAAAVGGLLGYPPCCTAAYLRFNALQKTNPRADVVPFIAAASGAGPYPFLLNDVLVFNSRRCYDADSAGIERLFRANIDRNVSLKLKAVISWHPCSFKCRPSLAAARRIWSALRRFAPLEAAALKDRLSKPLLYLGWSKFAAFEGRAVRNGLDYSRIVPPHSLLPAKALAALRAGDNLRLEPGAVRVRRGSAVLGVLRAPRAALLPFSPRSA